FSRGLAAFGVVGGELRLLADLVGLEDFVAHGMTSDVEVLAATGGVHPQFVVDAARVVAEEQVFAPLGVTQRIRVERTGDMRLALGMEFLFGAQFATVGTEDVQHVGLLKRSPLADANGVYLVSPLPLVGEGSGERATALAALPSPALRAPSPMNGRGSSALRYALF